MVPPTADKTAETSQRVAGHARMSENTFAHSSACTSINKTLDKNIKKAYIFT